MLLAGYQLDPDFGKALGLKCSTYHTACEDASPDEARLLSNVWGQHYPWFNSTDFKEIKGKGWIGSRVRAECHHITGQFIMNHLSLHPWCLPQWAKAKYGAFSDLLVKSRWIGSELDSNVNIQIKVKKSLPIRSLIAKLNNQPHITLQ